VPLGTVITVATGALSAALARRPGAGEAAG
jgi:hypothetical protein